MLTREEAVKLNKEIKNILSHEAASHPVVEFDGYRFNMFCIKILGMLKCAIDEFTEKPKPTPTPHYDKLYRRPNEKEILQDIYKSVNSYFAVEKPKREIQVGDVYRNGEGTYVFIYNKEFDNHKVINNVIGLRHSSISSSYKVDENGIILRAGHPNYNLDLSKRYKLVEIEDA